MLRSKQHQVSHGENYNKILYTNIIMSSNQINLSSDFPAGCFQTFLLVTLNQCERVSQLQVLFDGEC